MKNNNVYKGKYLDLRAKYLSDIDFAFRDGYEQGFDDGGQQAQQEAQAMQDQMMGQQEPGAEGEQPGGAEGVAPEDAAQQAPGQPGAENTEPTEEEQALQANGDGSGTEPLPPMEGELGKNIDELMSMLSKGSKPKLTDLRKVVEKIDILRKKSQEAIVDKEKIELVNGVFEKWEEN